MRNSASLSLSLTLMRDVRSEWLASPCYFVLRNAGCVSGKALGCARIASVCAWPTNLLLAPQREVEVAFADVHCHTAE